MMVDKVGNVHKVTRIDRQDEMTMLTYEAAPQMEYSLRELSVDEYIQTRLCMEDTIRNEHTEPSLTLLEELSTKRECGQAHCLGIGRSKDVMATINVVNGIEQVSKETLYLEPEIAMWVYLPTDTDSQELRAFGIENFSPAELDHFHGYFFTEKDFEPFSAPASITYPKKKIAIACGLVYTADFALAPNQAIFDVLLSQSTMLESEIITDTVSEIALREWDVDALEIRTGAQRMPYIQFLRELLGARYSGLAKGSLASTDTQDAHITLEMEKEQLEKRVQTLQVISA